MISGEHASDQPPEFPGEGQSDFTGGPPLPRLPETALRREAQLRSTRWIMAVLAVETLAYTAQMLYFLVTEGLSLAEVWMQRDTILPYFIKALATFTLALDCFHALSRPRSWTAAIIAFTIVARVVIGVLDVTDFLHYGLSGLSVTGVSPFIVYALMVPWIDPLVLGAILWLITSGPGKLVYSRPGIEYFARLETREPRKPDSSLPGLIYFTLCLVSWYVGTLLEKY